MKKRVISAVAVSPLVVALALTGCATSAGDSAASEKLQVVASTNVYGDIATEIAGDNADVVSLITSAAQDPHSYEASAQDRLKVSRADVVIENGGGYDPFIDTLLEAGAKDGVAVINASEVSGLMPGDAEGHDHGDDSATGDDHADHDHADEASGDADHADEASGDADHDHADEAADGAEAGHDHEGHDHIEGFNEHVWYSFDAMDKLAHEVAHELGEKDAANASTYEANYEAFSKKLDGLKESAGALAPQAANGGVAITEPVPLYLLQEVGLENKTPDAFSEAIEEGTDVSPAVLQETLAIFTDHEVKMLAYNEQTSGPETVEVEKAAKDAGIPVVSFTETMPEGDDYVSWMTKNIDAISSVLTQ